MAIPPEGSECRIRIELRALHTAGQDQEHLIIKEDPAQIPAELRSMLFKVDLKRTLRPI